MVDEVESAKLTYPRVDQQRFQQEYHQGPAADRNYADCVPPEATIRKLNPKKNGRKASFNVHSALSGVGRQGGLAGRTSRVINVPLIPARFPAPLITASRCNASSDVRGFAKPASSRGRNVLFPPFSLPFLPLPPSCHPCLLSRPRRRGSSADKRATRNESNVNPRRNYRSKLRRVFPYRLVLASSSDRATFFAACRDIVRSRSPALSIATKSRSGEQTASYSRRSSGNNRVES